MTNVSSNESKIFIPCDKHLDFIFWVLDGAAGLVVLAGNFLTCIVIISSPILRHNVMNVFLLSLAVADFLIGLIFVPGYASFCESCEYALSKYCHILSSAKDLPLAGVTFNLLAISYDRYMAVFRPLHYHSHMNSLRVGIILSSAWGIPIVMIITRSLLHYFWSTSRIDDIIKIYNTFLVVAFVILPIIILVVVNTMLTRALQRQNCRIHVVKSEIVSENASTVVKEKEVMEKHTKRRKGTISCIVVVLIFILCWFPRAFNNVWSLANRNQKINPVFRKITIFFLIVQSSVNPFIYTMYRREFRRAAKGFVNSLQFWRR
ncbi:adenosine receptor A2a-like [Actinia tenebrosa]|uniref:Adenosine receptor A2a-like n=1 Tax=Actinia tenebrosa TaxID=6105 RepID=A0A6P8J0E1_ACTTE|nr:adenosine receptor A2a-like [Actinia tenebrosa]